MAASIEKARKLRARIFDFVLNTHKEEYVAAHKERFGNLQAPGKQIPEKAWQDFMEAFIFDRGLEKPSLMESFRTHVKIEDRETKRMANSWDRVRHGMFRSETAEDGGAVAFSLISETGYPLHEMAGCDFPSGCLFVCRLFPLVDDTYIPGVVSIPPSSIPGLRKGFLKTALSFQAMSPPRALASNREKLLKSKEITERRYRMFIETFGSEEVTGPKEDILARLSGFASDYHEKEKEPALCTDMDSGADSSRLPETDLTILMHPLTGLDVLAGYRTFEGSCQEGSVKDEDKEVFVSYAVNLNRIPAVWARALRKHPEGTRKVLQTVVSEDKVEMFLSLAEQAFIVKTLTPPCIAVLDRELVSVIPELLAEMKANVSGKEPAGNVPQEGA